MTTRTLIALIFASLNFGSANAQSQAPAGPISGAMCNGMTCSVYDRPLSPELAKALIRKRIYDVALARDSELMLQNKQNLSCVLTLKSDGNIVDARILKTSGSNAIDKKALELLRTAGPYSKIQSTINVPYLVEFPVLKVKPINADNAARMSN